MEPQKGETNKLPQRHPQQFNMETLADLVEFTVSKPLVSYPDPNDVIAKLESNWDPTLIAKGIDNAKRWKPGKVTELMKQIKASGPCPGSGLSKVPEGQINPFPDLQLFEPNPNGTNTKPNDVRPFVPLSTSEFVPIINIPSFKEINADVRNRNQEPTVPFPDTSQSPMGPEKKRFKFHNKNATSTSSSGVHDANTKPSSPKKNPLFREYQNPYPKSLRKEDTEIDVSKSTAPANLETKPATTVSSSNGLGWFSSNNTARTSLFSELPPSDEEKLRRDINNVPVNPPSLNGTKTNPPFSATNFSSGKPEVITLTDEGGEEQDVKPGEFRSAYEQLLLNDKAKGVRRIGLSRARPPPKPSIDHIAKKVSQPQKSNSKSSDDEVPENPELAELMADERMKNIEPKMAEAVLNEVVEVGSSTDWNDIAGLEGVKRIIREIIIWPMQRPDIFTGLRGPPKGILLFGPPGTGKTMIGRLIATKSESTFFNISASSLTSKWIGDGEKMVRALFQVARVKQPAVIFIDEIDSILTQRSDTEHESSRRLKTEFLIQFDGCGTKSEDKILVIGVTNRPQELDEAARRRLVKRIYIPLPDIEGRKQLVRNLLLDQQTSLNDIDFDKIAEITDGYSGADMASLCKEASYGPIRDIGSDIQNIDADKVRPMSIQDFERALKQVKASVADSDLSIYENWDKQFGVTLT